jgi:hypothetical protein
MSSLLCVKIVHTFWSIPAKKILEFKLSYNREHCYIVPYVEETQKHRSPASSRLRLKNGFLKTNAFLKLLSFSVIAARNFPKLLPML